MWCISLILNFNYKDRSVEKILVDDCFVESIKFNIIERETCEEKKSKHLKSKTEKNAMLSDRGRMLAKIY